MLKENSEKVYCDFSGLPKDIKDFTFASIENFIKLNKFPLLKHSSVFEHDQYRSSSLHSTKIRSPYLVGSSKSFSL